LSLVVVAVEPPQILLVDTVDRKLVVAVRVVL
jgi:hypothetical protein